ncbi:claudin-1 [Brachyhypopomus gauderio]|uniref:claudin-1 n=1 Tax=Brachyhypopomus gauderio TaxID=698409 RepID=UPI0040419AB1
MANGGIQLLGFTLAFFGFIGLIISTTLTEWKMSSYAGDNIITAQAVYEGLWQSCVYQSTGQLQCKIYDSLLQLPMEIQAARGFMVAGILLSGVAILVAMVGMKCTKCLSEDKQTKNKVALTGGVIFIIAGICGFVATIWYGDNIRRQFFNPFTPTNARYEFGKALYIGWGSSALAIIGGSLLSCTCHGKSSAEKASRYPASRPRPAAQQGTGYV